MSLHVHQKNQFIKEFHRLHEIFSFEKTFQSFLYHETIRILRDRK